ADDQLEELEPDDLVDERSTPAADEQEQQSRQIPVRRIGTAHRAGFRSGHKGRIVSQSGGLRPCGPPYALTCGAPMPRAVRATRSLHAREFGSGPLPHYLSRGSIKRPKRCSSK